MIVNFKVSVNNYLVTYREMFDPLSPAFTRVHLRSPDVHTLSPWVQPSSTCGGLVDTAVHMLAALEGAMIISQTAGDLSMFDRVANELLN